MEQVPLDEDPYPNCKNAIAWFEYAFTPLDIEMARLGVKLLGKGVDDFVGSLHHATQIADPDKPEQRPGDRKLMLAADAEYDTADFRRYLTAKLMGGM